MDDQEPQELHTHLRKRKTDDRPGTEALTMIYQPRQLSVQLPGDFHRNSLPEPDEVLTFPSGPDFVAFLPRANWPTPKFSPPRPRLPLPRPKKFRVAAFQAG